MIPLPSGDSPSSSVRTPSVDNLYVELSYSDTPMIPVSLSSHPNDWSFNWRTDVPVMSSWTYDSDGDEKLTEIRVQVQSSIPLDDSTPGLHTPGS